MDPVETVRLFANPFTAVVAVIAASVEETPEKLLPESVRRWIGWLCVLACAPVAALLGQDVAPAMLGGFLGLGGSWLLVEAIRARRRPGVVPSRLTKETDMQHDTEPSDKPNQPPDPKPGYDDQPNPADDDPPPLIPPPPVK